MTSRNANEQKNHDYCSLKIRAKTELKKKLVCVHTSSFHYATEIEVTRLYAGYTKKKRATQ